MDNTDMFQLSLILGAIQTLFGMVLKAVNQTLQFGFKYADENRMDYPVGLMVVSALLPNVPPMGGTVHLVILGISGAMIFLIIVRERTSLAEYRTWVMGFMA